MSCAIIDNRNKLLAADATQHNGHHHPLTSYFCLILHRFDRASNTISRTACDSKEGHKASQAIKVQDHVRIDSLQCIG